jgi:hypothetical protein
MKTQGLAENHYYFDLAEGKIIIEAAYPMTIWTIFRSLLSFPVV